jgi:hypothetical protein
MKINRFKGSLTPISNWVKKIQDNKHDIDYITELVDSKYIRIIFVFKKEENTTYTTSEQWTNLLSK